MGRGISLRINSRHSDLFFGLPLGWILSFEFLFTDCSGKELDIYLGAQEWCVHLAFSEQQKLGTHQVLLCEFGCSVAISQSGNTAVHKEPLKMPTWNPETWRDNTTPLKMTLFDLPQIHLGWQIPKRQFELGLYRLYRFVLAGAGKMLLMLLLMMQIGTMMVFLLGFMRKYILGCLLEKPLWDRYLKSLELRLSYYHAPSPTLFLILLCIRPLVWPANWQVWKSPCKSFVSSVYYFLWKTMVFDMDSVWS